MQVEARIHNPMHSGQHDKHEASYNIHKTFINSSELGETVFQMEEGAVKIPRLSRKYEIGRKFGKETAPPPGWRLLACCGHNKFLLEVIKLALANLINRS